MLPGKDNFSHHIQLFVVLDATTWELPPKWGKTHTHKTPNYNFQTVLALFPLGFLRRKRCYICPVLHCVPAPLPLLCTVGGIGMGDRQQPLLLPALCYGPGESRTSWWCSPSCPGSCFDRDSSREDFSCPSTPNQEDTAFLQTQPPFSEQFWQKGGWQRPCTLRLPPSSSARMQAEHWGLSRCIQNRP